MPKTANVARFGPKRGAEERVRELEDEVQDLRSELQRSERRIEAMKQIGRVLGSNLALDPLLAEIVSRTTQLLEADRSTLFLVDHDKRELCSKVAEGAEVKEIRVPFGAGVASWVAEKGEPLHVDNAYEDTRFNPEFDRKSGYKTRSMLAWPVRRPHDDRVTAVIQVLNKRRGTFDFGDERLLETIASEIGVALEVARLFSDVVDRTVALEQTRKKLMLLVDTERVIAEATDLTMMLKGIIETALINLGARTGAVYLLDEAQNELVLAAASGKDCALLGTFDQPSGDALLSEALMTSRAVISNGWPEVERGELHARSACVVPIQDRVLGTLGVLELLNKLGKGGHGEFTQRDGETLHIVASQAGRAIRAEKARVERERGERLTAIGRMLSSVVHDMKTPLTLVSGYAQMMAESDAKSDRRHGARKIQKQIDAMTAMVKDLLAYARGERSLLIRKVFLDRFLDEMEEHLTTEFKGSGIDLVVHRQFAGVARFDETKMRRVFHNIARNAREAMPGGGTFVVTTKKVGGDVVFEFADTGPGIARNVEGRLFEPFVTSGKATGTGLGLAIVKRIAEEHRGTVTFTSEPKRGTRFVFALPSDA